MGHNHHHQTNAEKNIAIVFILNAVFVVVEIVGGILTNSIAILSDALHDLGDCLSLGTAWFMQKKAKQERNTKYSYGYKRFSLLGSIFLSGVLVVSSIFIFTEAIGRITNPQNVDATGMLWMAVFGIVINGAAALRIKKGTSLNERSVYLHIMEDVLGWIAVLVASIVMIFIEISFLDPLLSIAISIWVLSNVYKNMRDTFKILLQAVPKNILLPELMQQLEATPNVLSVHDLHIWSLDGESHVMTLHAVTTQTDTTSIKEQLIEIAKEHHIIHTTIEFETPNAICSTNCDSR